MNDPSRWNCERSKMAAALRKLASDFDPNEQSHGQMLERDWIPVLRRAAFLIDGTEEPLTKDEEAFERVFGTPP